VAGLMEDEKEAVVLKESLAMAQVLLNSAMAISGATASGSSMPFPANLIAIISGVTAVGVQIVSSIAAIKKAKSAYAEGTDYHRGGSALIGEKAVNGQWQKEVVQTPDNKLFIVDKPTYFDRLPIGTSVTPLPEFDYGSFDYKNYNDNREIVEELRELRQAFYRLENKPTAEINVGREITTYLKTINSKTKIINSKFKF